MSLAYANHDGLCFVNSHTKVKDIADV